ncbi:MAG: 50S ribosomal protein L13 [bacterium]|nr:50S ribosomal protein L13 [bacterium]
MAKYIIDAQGKKLGRVASEAAHLLRGKGSAGFTPNELPETMVEIINAAKLSVTVKKDEGTEYTRYTGYPGGFKTQTRKEFTKKRGHVELLRRTILGMLPKNRLRPRIIRHLTVKN